MRKILSVLLLTVSITCLSQLSLKAQCQTEICDGVDNDCDGSVDEGFHGIYFADIDRDGHGGSQVIITSCTVASGGYVLTGGDCDDNDVTKWRSQELFVDNDGDGFTTIKEFVCFGDSIPKGYTNSSKGDDFNDASSAAYPNATERCDGIDNNGDGREDEGFFDYYHYDNDKDGYGAGHGTANLIYTTSCNAAANGYVLKTGDCNDNDPTVWRKQRFYEDKDGDGYHSITSTYLCYGANPPAGFTTATLGPDCDDTHSNAHPGAEEVEDGYDNNCDGYVDEGFLPPPTSVVDRDGDGHAAYYYGGMLMYGDCNDNDPLVWRSVGLYVDADGDGYHISSQFVCMGLTVPRGFSAGTLGMDFNDNSAKAYPGAPEICDDIDNNGNGDTDEGFYGIYYQDADGDGVGSGALIVDKVCKVSPAHKYVLKGGDCLEGDPSIWRTAYLNFDGDNDGYYSKRSLVCYGATMPAGYSDTSKAYDCNDNNPTIHKGAAEICDGIDNNCDGTIDEGFYSTYYVDEDGDGYGQVLQYTTSCNATEKGYVLKNGDCQDHDASNRPGNWTGNAGSNWNDRFNWSCYVPPAPGADVVIPSGTTNVPALDSTAIVGNIDLIGRLDLSGKTLTINGTVTGNGTIIGSATSNIIINGNAGVLKFDPGSAILQSLKVNTGGSAKVETNLLITGK